MMQLIVRLTTISHFHTFISWDQLAHFQKSSALGPTNTASHFFFSVT